MPEIYISENKPEREIVPKGMYAHERQWKTGTEM